MGKGNDKNDKRGKADGADKPKRKAVFYAGFVAGETVDDVDAAWETFKANPDAFPQDTEADVEPDEDEDADAEDDSAN
jgi:hypothetical protein